MKNQITVTVFQDGDWFVAYCREVPGANGQGKTREEAIESLEESIHLLWEDQQEEILKSVPRGAERTTLTLVHA